MRVVCCSDTHGLHRQVEIPKGDIFIHAGDFTRCANLGEAKDFNDWLGEETIFGDFKLKIVVNGNHESTASWQSDIKTILTNAVFLKNELYEYEYHDTNGPGRNKEESPNRKTASSGDRKNMKRLKIWGCNFFWPMEGSNPYYDDIPNNVDILIAHGPARGYVDGNHGCPTLLNRVQELVRPNEPKRMFRFLGFINKSKQHKDEKLRDTRLLVVSGHIHMAHGVQHMAISTESGKRVTFVNAAIANNEHSKGDGRGWEEQLSGEKRKERGNYIIEWQPVVVDL